MLTYLSRNISSERLFNYNKEYAGIFLYLHIFNCKLKGETMPEDLMTLANKYRPTEFEDVCDQEVCTRVLTNQIKKNKFSHAQLFAGHAGCGKTTCAKIFAKKINGEIIELDCATHGGVAEIKEIVEKARIKPLLHDYKVVILDECHCITKEGWSSLLIVLEEHLPSTIFVFCTTDTQKIPDTIMSRVQRLDFLPISNKGIAERLKTIMKLESIEMDDEALKYLVKSARGSLRQALTNLDKCLLYDDLSVDSVRKVLNMVSIDIFADICEAYNNSDTNKIIELIENVYNSGYELHQFTRQLLDYCIAKRADLTLVERLLATLQDIRYDDSPKNIIIARLIV